MYSQMLSEAVSRKQGKNSQVEKTTVEIDLGVDAYLPETYVAINGRKSRSINEFVNLIRKKC